MGGERVYSNLLLLSLSLFNNEIIYYYVVLQIQRENERRENRAPQAGGHLFMYNALTFLFSFFFFFFFFLIFMFTFPPFLNGKNVKCINIRMYILQISLRRFPVPFFTDSPTTSFANSERKRTTLCTHPSLNLQLKRPILRCRPNTSNGDVSATVTL